MKKIVFITGTRADFGKIKSLIDVLLSSKQFQVFIFTTGMHLNPKFGGTVNEVAKQYPENYFPFYNHHDNYSMDETLAKTLDGFGLYVKDIKPDMIICHGDRVEAMAAALVGSTNNILTAHIEGGEVSGTIDDSLRHSISKMCHVHFVANKIAKKRLMQMGEKRNSIFVIGSPDIDILLSKNLPTLSAVKKYYDIPFKDYAILMFHPVTTEQESISQQAAQICDAVNKSIHTKHLNYIVIQPNNDTGSHNIMTAYNANKYHDWHMVKMFPNLKFEYFLTLLKHAKFIIGNSSAGIREAGYYGVPCINIGTRQQGRSSAKHIINCEAKYKQIANAISLAVQVSPCAASTMRSRGSTSPEAKGGGMGFGTGNSSKQFIGILRDKKIWKTAIQKTFVDLNDF